LEENKWKKKEFTSQRDDIKEENQRRGKNMGGKGSLGLEVVILWEGVLGKTSQGKKEKRLNPVGLKMNWWTHMLRRGWVRLTVGHPTGERRGVGGGQQKFTGE